MLSRGSQIYERERMYVSLCFTKRSHNFRILDLPTGESLSTLKIVVIYTEIYIYVWEGS